MFFLEYILFSIVIFLMTIIYGYFFSHSVKKVCLTAILLAFVSFFSSIFFIGIIYHFGLSLKGFGAILYVFGMTFLMYLSSRSIKMHYYFVFFLSLSHYLLFFLFF